MFRRKIWLNNQDEFQAMTQKLESLEIPYTSHKVDDASMPVIESANNFWSLSIPENYSRKFFRNTEGELVTEIYVSGGSQEDLAGGGQIFPYSLSEEKPPGIICHPDKPSLYQIPAFELPQL